MCTVVVSTMPGDAWPLLIGANRDERLDRPWEEPGRYWDVEHPGTMGPRDIPGGGTWLALGPHGVAAAVLNRVGSLGPAPNKRSRGELPLMAAAANSAEEAARRIAATDAGRYRSYNMIVGDRDAAFFLCGLGYGHAEITRLEPGLHMIATGAPDDMTIPRIARHLPRFQNTALPRPPDWNSWAVLLSDRTLPAGSELNIPPRSGFGTTNASLLGLPADPRAPASWMFAAGPPDRTAFHPIELAVPEAA
ncbi:MAG: NRDE family protein [Gluconacetobacter diazotrophicus]|nr:NRDE family protein [Gluconacetobacter diazotrophicus]